MEQENVLLELCRSNSIGSHYHEPSVLGIRSASREVADQLLARKTSDGTFWREMVDYTGAGY